MRLAPSLVTSSLLLALVSAPARAAPAPPPGTPAEPEAPAQSLPPIAPHDTCNEQPLHARFRITLEKEARLTDLVRWMSSVSCTKFIWSPTVRDGKVTVIAPEPVTMQQAHAAFYAALETMGLTVEQSGDYLKIVESKGAAHKVVPVYGPDDEVPARDRFVTRLYRPQAGRVDDVVAVVEHLQSERGTVTAVGDLVIITDTGSSIDRLMKVVAEVDTEPQPADAIFLQPLRHADPEELATVVREVFMERATASAPAPRATKGKTKTKAKEPSEARSAATTAAEGPRVARISAVSIDARTRTLIITASREDFPVVRRFIERLDVESDGSSGTLFVLPLRHADPEEIATVLGSLPGQGKGQGGAGPASPAAGEGATAAGGVSIGGEIHITADPATRSLVVMASPHDFIALRRVIEALDVERRLVYIETYILELSTNHQIGSDVSGHFGRDVANGGVGFVGSQPGDVSSAVLDASVLSGLAAGVVGPGIPGTSNLLGTGQDIPAFGVVIQALELSEDVNIVSHPHLYTADNKTARMEVGQRIPVPTGTNTISSAGLPVTNTAYAREDVALQLEVTPHVGEGGGLTLDILIENQEVVKSDSEGGPTTTKRRLELEEVIARDGQPVVLGGLMMEKEQIIRRQIPGLGSIPLLGWLFKKKSRTREKVNLLVILVPHVLDSPDDARRIHERRLAERRELLERETAFERRDLQTHVNYRRKSGLLAAVQAEGVRMEHEATLRTAAEHELARSAADRVAPDGVYEVTAATE